ncbi:MAG: hypothetical protein A3F72_07035 [Bacteroidetes bacterium RIFCSPLOWO2_12_FULL_35_15]|nr:MAG: hypothetical protein A3F72_07035 [Bacteroidetes bacterium RIFCSPLOWO2_12_FULL_35_15]
MNSIIVDDDKMARIALKQLISNFEFLNLKKECCNAMEAYNYLKKETIDLVFLNVEMPGMSGIELIKNLVRRPIIVLISSNKDYAVEAFELYVADYIVRPVSPERFSKAVSKVKDLFDIKDLIIHVYEKEADFIFVRSNSKLTRIKINDIIFIQAIGDSVDIITKDKCNTVNCTLENMEEKLPVNKFYRLHSSFLVSTSYIDNVEDNVAYLGHHVLPIEEQYKTEVYKKFNRN